MKRSFYMTGTTHEKYKSQAAQTFQEGDDFWKKGDYDSARQAYEKAAFFYHEKNKRTV